MARTLAEEYRGLFDELRTSAAGGPWAVLRRLRELMGQRGVDVGRLRERLNQQLVRETERVVRDLLSSNGERLARQLGSLSIPALEAFGSRLATVRELYLDDAVRRIEGEEDELKRAFLERLDDWATRGYDLDVGDIIDRMKRAADGRARFFARDQFSRFNRSVAVASYREAGAGYVEWLNSSDGRVRPAHGAKPGPGEYLGMPLNDHRIRNHKIYTQSELERDPEWHSWNCRCGFVPLWEPLTEAQRRRRVA
jgi:hypothetical protein